MDEGEQLTFRRSNIAINGLCKCILSSAPVQRRERPTDRETLAHGDKAGFPWRIWIGDAATGRNDIPSLPFAPYRLKQCNRAKVRITVPAHSAAFTCCGELCTGRRALWTG